jgi:AraC family transcriptional regulator
VDCVDRVNRAIDHVTRNLDQPLKLEDVARVACFSSFHFHRVFRVVVGETLAQFVKRVRLERALYLLTHRPGIKLTEVALACGFTSSSDFSRSFRARYGVPPRRFSIDAHRDARRPSIEALFDPSLESHRVARLPPGANPDGFSVRLRDVPARRVAYTRVYRPFEGDRVSTVAREMLAWARERGVADGQWLGFMWDDPEIVALEQCRYDVGLEIPRDLQVGGEVSVTEFPAMKLAEVDVVGPLDLELRALDWIYGSWLPTSGWAPDHQPCFEAWNGDPFAHGTTHFDLRVQLAVVDAALPP